MSIIEWRTGEESRFQREGPVARRGFGRGRHGVSTIEGGELRGGRGDRSTNVSSMAPAGTLNGDLGIVYSDPAAEIGWAVGLVLTGVMGGDSRLLMGVVGGDSRLLMGVVGRDAGVLTGVVGIEPGIWVLSSMSKLMA
jgi:hypothetical protein